VRQQHCGQPGRDEPPHRIDAMTRSASRPRRECCGRRGLSRPPSRLHRQAATRPRWRALPDDAKAACRTRDRRGTHLLDDTADLHGHDDPERDRHQQCRIAVTLIDEPGLIDGFTP